MSTEYNTTAENSNVTAVTVDENIKALLIERLRSAMRIKDGKELAKAQFAWCEASTLIELQTLGPDKKDGAYHAFSQDPAKAVELSECLSYLKYGKITPIDFQGVYFTVNAHKDGFEARPSQLDTWMFNSGLTTNEVIGYRRALYIDLDTRRKNDLAISATDTELLYTCGRGYQVYVEIVNIIREIAPEIVDPEAALGFMMSGNGVQIWVRLANIPETEKVEALVRSSLHYMSQLFSGTGCKVDVSVCDAKRIGPVAGTMKKKGGNYTPANVDKGAWRPHRRVAWCSKTEVGHGLTEAQLEAFAANLLAKLSPEQRKAAEDTINRAVDKKSTPTAKSNAPRNVAVQTGPHPYEIAGDIPTSEVLGVLGLYDGKNAKCPICDKSDGTKVNEHVFYCYHETCNNCSLNNIGLVARKVFGKDYIKCDTEEGKAASKEAYLWLAEHFRHLPALGGRKERLAALRVEVEGKIATNPSYLSEKVKAAGESISDEELSALVDEIESAPAAPGGTARAALKKKYGLNEKRLKSLSKPAKEEAEPEEGEWQRGDEAEASERILAHYSIAGSDIAAEEDLYRYDADQGIYVTLPLDEIKTLVASWAGASVVHSRDHVLKVSNGFTKGAYALAFSRAVKTDCGEAGFFASAPPALGFRNGVLVIENGSLVLDEHGLPKLHPHSPEWRLKARYNFDYVPGLVPHRLLDKVKNLPSEGMKDITCWREHAGASLFGLAPKYERAIIMKGEGRSGKSKLLELTELSFPPATVSHVPPQLMHEMYHRARLVGRRMNIVYDCQEKGVLDTGPLKEAITGDKMTARNPYERPIDFRPMCGQSLAMNKLFGHTDNTSAWERRWIIIEFQKKLKNIDPDFVQNMKPEIPALVSWFVDGLVDLMARGHYDLPETSKRLVSEWIKEGSNVSAFLDSAVDILSEEARAEKSPAIIEKTWTKSKSLYDLYTMWATSNGFKCLNITNFGKEMRGTLSMWNKAGEIRSGNYFPVKPKQIQDDPAIDDALNAAWKPEEAKPVADPSEWAKVSVLDDQRVQIAWTANDVEVLPPVHDIMDVMANLGHTFIDGQLYVRQKHAF